MSDRDFFQRSTVELAAKFYQAQSAAKFLFGEEYDRRTEPWRQLIRGFVAGRGCTEVEAAKQFLERLQAQPEDTAGAQLLLLAAAVDVCEGKDGSP